MRLSLKAILIVTHYTVLTFGVKDCTSITATILSILQAIPITEQRKLRLTNGLLIALLTNSLEQDCN